MARYDFGGTLADFVVTPRRLGGLDTLALSAATLTFWSAQSGGTRYTDLQLNGSASSSISVGTDGQVPTFQGPDSVTAMWVDGGAGRVRIVAQGIPGPAGPGATNSDIAAYVTGSGATKDALSATFAAARPVDMRAEPGVDATGVACSTAVQTAVTRANSIGAKKVWRDGTYKFSGVVDAPGNNKDIDWSTDGSNVVLKPATGGGATMLTIDGGTSNRQRQSIKGIQVDLGTLDAQFLLTKGFGGRGLVEDVTVFNPSTTLTNALIQFGDGVSAPNNVVAGHVKNVKVKGASTTNGTAFKFGSRVDSWGFEGVHCLNIGTGVANDPATCVAGSSLRFYGECIFEQATTGISLTNMSLSGLTVRDTRFEACSTVAIDLQGFDGINNTMNGVGIHDIYVSGMGAASIGLRLSRTKGLEVEGVHFRALDGLGTYPTAIPFWFNSPNFRVRLRRITTENAASVSSAMTGFSNLFARNDCMSGEIHSFDSQILMSGVNAVKVVAGTGVVSDASFTLPNGTTQAIVNGSLALNEAGELWGKVGPLTGAAGTWKKITLA